MPQIAHLKDNYFQLTSGLSWSVRTKDNIIACALYLSSPNIIVRGTLSLANSVVSGRVISNIRKQYLRTK